MTDDIFTTDQDILSNILLSDDDAADFADEDLTPSSLYPMDLDNEEDPDEIEKDSFDDEDEF